MALLGSGLWGDLDSNAKTHPMGEGNQGDSQHRDKPQLSPQCPTGFGVGTGLAYLLSAAPHPRAGGRYVARGLGTKANIW